MFGHFFKNVIIKNIDLLIDSLCPPSRIVEYRDHHFLDRLDAGSLVVDLGAHKGEFSAQISSAFGCRCISVEANPDLCGGIAESPLIKKYNYAICGQSGPVRLFLSSNPEATSIVKDISDFWGTKEAIEVPGIRFEDFVEQYMIPKIDLLKVDIEGMEIEMLESMSDETIRGIEQITVEFHRFCNPPMAKEIPRIKQRLQRLGFLCLPFPFQNSFGIDCDTLFVNRKRVISNPEERPGIGIALHALRMALYLRVMILSIRNLKNRFVSF